MSGVASRNLLGRGSKQDPGPFSEVFEKFPRVEKIVVTERLNPGKKKTIEVSILTYMSYGPDLESAFEWLRDDGYVVFEENMMPGTRKQTSKVVTSVQVYAGGRSSWIVKLNCGHEQRIFYRPEARVLCNKCFVPKQNCAGGRVV